MWSSRVARVDISLGISELTWMGMGKFNSDDHYIYYCGKESLRRNGGALRVNKRVWNAVLGCSLKNDRMILVYFQGKPFYITVIQVYAPTTEAEETEVERSYEDWQDLLVIESRSVMSNCLWVHGLHSPWNSPGQKTGVGSFSLLQGTFSTQGSNPGLPHWGGFLTTWVTREGSRTNTKKDVLLITGDWNAKVGH